MERGAKMGNLSEAEREAEEIYPKVCECLCLQDVLDEVDCAYCATLKAIQHAETRGYSQGKQDMQDYSVMLIEEKNESYKKGLLRGAEIGKEHGADCNGVDEAIRKEANK